MSTQKPLKALYFCTIIATTTTIAIISTTDVYACQPEPDTGYVSSTLPQADSTDVAIDTPITLRWSAQQPHHSSDATSFYYYANYQPGDIPTENIQLQIQRNGEPVDLEGELQVDQDLQEVRFVSVEPLAPNSTYTVQVTLDWNDYIWSFTTGTERGFAEMIAPDFVLEDISITEKANPTYFYCDYNPDDPDFICIPEHGQDGWSYRPLLQVQFTPHQNLVSGPSTVRYVLKQHESMQDTTGQAIYVFDAIEPGSQVLSLENVLNPEADEVCFSVETYYHHNDIEQGPIQSSIRCEQMSNIIRIDRLPDPAPLDLSCLKETDPDMGGDMGGDMEDTDIEQDMEQDMEGTDTEQDNGGWTLNDNEDPIEDDSCAGCSSSHNNRPDSSFFLSLLLGGLFFLRRRTHRS